MCARAGVKFRRSELYLVKHWTGDGIGYRAGLQIQKMRVRVPSCPPKYNAGVAQRQSVGFPPHVRDFEILRQLQIKRK